MKVYLEKISNLLFCRLTLYFFMFGSKNPKRFVNILSLFQNTVMYEEITVANLQESIFVKNGVIVKCFFFSFM